jgi:UPF0716 protein FxsA
MRASLERGELPALPMIEGVLLLLGGALLLTPGFLTDAFGLALLIAPVRRRLAEVLLRGSLMSVFGSPAARQGGRRARILEGEFERERDEPRP